MKRLVEIGDVFGRLTVLKETAKKHGRIHYLCECICGNQKIVMKNNLFGGQVKSCGCLRRESRQNVTHGQKGTRLYRIWSGMKTRCLNKNDKAFSMYGGRGIGICDEWIDFDGFQEWANSNGYDENLTIERKDVDEGYYPSNCEWIPLSEQAQNRTNTLRLTFKGQTKTLKEWSRITGIEYPTLHARIERGWSVEKTLSNPSLINRKKQEELNNDKQQ